MKRSDRMEKINVINNGIKTLAGANLARAEQEYAQQLHQLEQLRIYKEEYAEQLRQRMAGQVRPDEIQDYRYFFSSLYRAISQQESIVAHLKNQVENCRREWLARDQEVRKLNKVGDRLRQVEEEDEVRKEQKRSDELMLGGNGRFAMSFKH